MCIFYPFYLFINVATRIWSSVSLSIYIYIRQLIFKEHFASRCIKSNTHIYTQRCVCDSSTMSELNNVLKFKKLTEHAFTPSKGSKLAAGFDLYSAYDLTIPANGKSLVKTDIQIELPEGCYGRIAPRSGLSWKHHLDVGAGVIDRDYRGDIGVILFNHAKSDYKVKKGDRIAQLICEKIIYPDIEQVEELTKTERGEGGYGSTGKQ